MQISNEIVLRPRFSQALDINQNKVLELFENEIPRLISFVFKK